MTARARVTWRLLKKLNTELPYDPVIPLLNIHPKQVKQVFKEKLVPKYSKQHYSQLANGRTTQRLSTDEWLSKVWCICTMEYDSAIKMNQVPIV